MSEGREWACLGPGEPHPVDLERVASCYNRGDTEIAIERCRACRQLYHFSTFELHDWTGENDYYDRTDIWTPIEADEAEALRRDDKYKPRSERSHRHDTGWRAG
ncbi:MAG TPA: hypothetical protein VEW25_10850 [Allosphingosinicella sp.]|nr:hypothetical protein [Allosphingosinicella sp.]